MENSRGPIRLLQNNTNNTSTCGNSIVETGETCDDGNNADGDGCSSTCKKEDASLALPLALGISLGTVALIGIIIGKIALTKSSITAGAVSGIKAGQRPLEI